MSATAASEARPNEANQAPSGGIPSAKKSRFEGLAIGSSVLAALATSAHAKTYGSAPPPARSVLPSAASTAGVSTTIVASLERNAVVTTPAP